MRFRANWKRCLLVPIFLWLVWLDSAYLLLSEWYRLVLRWRVGYLLNTNFLMVFLTWHCITIVKWVILIGNTLVRVLIICLKVDRGKKTFFLQNRWIGERFFWRTTIKEKKKRKVKNENRKMIRKQKRKWKR